MCFFDKLVIYILQHIYAYISVALNYNMSHIEIYSIKGKKYRYEITNYRIGKKVRHKKKYLGPVKPINKTKKRKIKCIKK